jgi:hypothetical protein
MLTKLELDIPGTCITETADHLPDLLIRLPDKEHELTYDDPRAGITPVRTIFLSFQLVNRTAGDDDPVLGLVIGIDVNERDRGLLPIHTMKVFPLDDRNVEDVIDSLPPHFTTHEGMQVPNDLINKCIKLCLTLRLLENSPELIEPDVLSKDRHRYENGDEELRKRLLDKARRRGKFGFSVGRAVERGEMSPHYRRGHLCLVWTGPGRKVPKIRPRKGSLVRRDKVEKIPTGYNEDTGSRSDS